MKFEILNPGDSNFCTIAANVAVLGETGDHMVRLGADDIDPGMRGSGLIVNEFVVHYQPKLDLVSGVICGAEALLRWNSPAIGLCEPSYFMGNLRELGGLYDVEKWVLLTACLQLREWIVESGNDSLQVSVNISPGHLVRPEFAVSVSSALSKSGLRPENLIIEITEAEPMPDVARIAAVTRKESICDVQFSLDDFGTGCSSISHIRDIPVSEIKIDRTYISGFPASARDGAIVRSLLTLGRSLDLRVVAEGVERAEQLEELRRLGCDVVQGFLVGLPMPPDQLLDMLVHRKLI